jgi:steroid 5-alpha reductase family enzyme
MSQLPVSDSPGRVLPAVAAKVTLCVVIVGLVAWACAQGGLSRWGVPVVFLGAALAVALNWIAFLPAFAARTERYYDLTGSLTYLSVTATALLAAGTVDARAVTLAALVAIWASRLGLFLFRRIRAEGKDARFDEVKTSGPRFFLAWTLQAVWVFLTLAAALTAITTATPAPLGIWFGVGLGVWLAGFTIEVVADRQKRAFRRANDTKTEFITTGLWAWSRHPNYFGEVVLWVGVAIAAAPTFVGWQWVALVSPLFVYLLLTRGSGVPILERRADARWGGQPEYESYKARTPVLFPRPPVRGVGRP